jgi:perosamine synthetase
LTGKETSLPDRIPLWEPEISGNEWAYVKECLDSGWVSSAGPFVERFEQMLADYTGARYAVATVNGTAALHIALLVAGVQPEDEVLVPALTFIAPVNAIRYVGAWPVFIDSDPEYWQMDPQNVADFLDRECCWREGTLKNRTTGRRVKAILPVHILGHPVDIDPIMAAARKFGLVVIEDAAESLGARYKGKPVGHLSDISCFSFNGNKIVTSGGGGMIVTDNPSWAARARYLTTQAKDDAVEYRHGEVGFNYRLTNIQAAVGCAQMERLDALVSAKRELAARYSAGIASAGITPMREAEWAFATFWLYTIRVDEALYGMSSRGLLKRLIESGIETRPLWLPIHRNVPYLHSAAYQVSVANQLYEETLSLPSAGSLGQAELCRVVEAVRSAGVG